MNNDYKIDMVNSTPSGKIVHFVDDTGIEIGDEIVLDGETLVVGAKILAWSKGGRDFYRLDKKKNKAWYF